MNNWVNVSEPHNSGLYVVFSMYVIYIVMVRRN